MKRFLLPICLLVLGACSGSQKETQQAEIIDDVATLEEEEVVVNPPKEVEDVIIIDEGKDEIEEEESAVTALVDRVVESRPKFKSGFYRFANDCAMYSQANRGAARVGLVTKGKKLWVDAYSTDWVRVYKKAGPVYVMKSCLKK